MKFIRSGVVLAGDEGLRGRMYGGKLLSILDSVGVVAVSKTCDGEFVTASTKSVFLKPIYVGDITDYYYSVELGNTSIKVNMEVKVEGELRATAMYTFVHIIEGKPSKLKIK